MSKRFSFTKSLYKYRTKSENFKVPLWGLYISQAFILFKTEGLMPKAIMHQIWTLLAFTKQDGSNKLGRGSPKDYFYKIILKSYQ